MKVVVIGYEWAWHHSQNCIAFFKYLEWDIEYIPPNQLPKSTTSEVCIVVEDNVDFVLVFQIEPLVYIHKSSEHTIIMQFCGEVYWKPSCTNADYLITAFPEMMDRYRFQYPAYFDHLRGALESRMFINPEEFYYQMPKKAGIYFQGAINAGRGRYNFRAYRVGYKDRADFITENNSIIKYTAPKYDNKAKFYQINISQHEAELVIHGLDVYMSKRPLENAAAGAINLLYIKDAYQIKYYEELGFFHMKNCYYIINRQDLFDFQQLPTEEKQMLRTNANKLIHERFTLHTLWNEWLEFIESTFDSCH